MTFLGITHAVNMNKTIRECREFGEWGFLWFACDGDHGVLGYTDEPTQAVTCLLCIAT